ncbi:MAG: hypothetical protein WDN47_05315 [Candidatus Doudnabacteria bacterium]
MENDNQNQLAESPTVASVPLQPPPKHKMKLWKKILMILVILIIVIGAGIYFLPFILTVLHPGDATLIDDSQLTLQKVSVPDADNGFYDLNKITPTMINVPSNDQKIAFDLEYTDFTKPVQWDQHLVDQVLSQNQQALSLFDAAAGKGHVQVPDYANPININPNTAEPPTNTWRSAARLQAIKALSLSAQGKPDEALLEAAKLNKVGYNIINGHNGLIGVLVGLAIRQLGSQTILRILPFNNPGKQTLETVRTTLQDSSNNLEGYKDGFRFDYTNISNQITQTVKDGDVSSFAYAKYAKYGYYYKPNQTKNLFTNLYNSQVAAIGVKCDLAESNQQLNTTLSQFAVDISSRNLPFAENAIGKNLFSTFAVSLGSVVTKECQNDLIANVAQIELAIKEYEMDKGQLPNTLAELVPQYLTAVPQDPFDHQPIRYSATKKILYSVGLKNQDLGGSTGNDWTSMDNPTFQISF